MNLLLSLRFTIPRFWLMTPSFNGALCNFFFQPSFLDRMLCLANFPLKNLTQKSSDYKVRQIYSCSKGVSDMMGAQQQCPPVVCWALSFSTILSWGSSLREYIFSIPSFSIQMVINLCFFNSLAEPFIFHQTCILSEPLLFGPSYWIL